MGLSTTFSTVAPVGKQRLTRPYQWLIVAIGAVISIFYVWHLPVELIDLRFLLLTSLTILIGARGAVKSRALIPTSRLLTRSSSWPSYSMVERPGFFWRQQTVSVRGRGW